MYKESDTKVPSTKVTFLKLWPKAAGCTMIKTLLHYDYNARLLIERLKAIPNTNTKYYLIPRSLYKLKHLALESTINNHLKTYSRYYSII